MPLNSNFVPPEGDPQSRMWLIGEAPGEMENKVGIPFVGRAGERLDIGLKDAGILRGQCFVWNIFHKRPPGNKVDYFFTDTKNKILSEEGYGMLEAVKVLIEEWKPNLIVALGGTALYFLTGKKRITKWRGSVLPCTLSPAKVYATYHPSYVMRLMQEAGDVSWGSKYKVTSKERKNQNVYPTFVKDLMRASYQAEFPEIVYPERESTIVQSVAELESIFQGIPADATVASDIETFHKNKAPWRPFVTRIGFAMAADGGFTVPFTHGNRLCWTLEEWTDIVRLISEFYLSDRKFIFQNGFYDLVVLGAVFGIRVKKIPFDTMIQQHCVYPHLPKGLAYQVSVYTWEPYFKDDAKSHVGGVMDEALSHYNIKDCCTTKEIQPITYNDIRRGNYLEGYERTLSLYPAILYMMLRGVKFDVEKRDDMRKRLTPLAEELLQKIKEKAGDENFNPGSPKQLQYLFYSKMGLPEQRSKEGSVTTNKNALYNLKKMTGDPVFDWITDYRKYSKLLSTYVEMEVSEDGRVYTTYDPTGTSTWRIASYESPLGVGGNLTNIPKRDEEGREIRELFVADEGKILFAADYSQAEDRYVVTKAGDIEAINRYDRGEDAHWATAIALFNLQPGTPFDKTNSEHYRMRNSISKHVRHASNYGMGPRQLQRMFNVMADLDMPYGECVSLLRKQESITPMIQQWKRWVRDKIRTDRTLVTALGRKRIFQARLSDDLFRQAYAFEPQSTVGELLLVALSRIHRHFDPATCEVLMDVHDEVIGQISIEADLEMVLRKIKELMTIPLIITDVFGQKRELIIPTEFQVGPNWGALEDIEI